MGRSRSFVDCWPRHPLSLLTEASDAGTMADAERRTEGDLGFQPPRTLVYKRWNFAVKVPLSPTFADPRRAFHAAILARQSRCSITRSDMACARPGHPRTAWDKEPSNWDYHVRQMFTIPVPTRYHGFSAVTLRAAALAIPLAKAANGQAPGLESRRHRSGGCRLMGKPSFPNNKPARPKY